MITADFELVPEDDLDARGAMIEAFRLRGIFADGVASLAEESLLWENVERKLPPLGPDILSLLPNVFFEAVRSFDVGVFEASPPDVPESQQRHGEDEGEPIELDNVTDAMYAALHEYAFDNAEALGLSDRTIQVRGFHPVFRVAPNGRLLIELVAQFTQADRSRKDQLGGIPFRGGCTLIASSNGSIRYLISKPMNDARGDAPRAEAGKARLARQESYVAACDMRNPLTPYATDAESTERMLELMSFAHLHGG
jgi:hypothetical protein